MLPAQPYGNGIQMYRKQINKGQRYYLLDNIRGFCIILVVIYHAWFNLVEANGFLSEFFNSDFIYVARDICVGVFVLISGMCCQFSRSNLKRGLIAAFVALLITVFTAEFMPEYIIRFGIIHMFGCCMLLYALLEPIFSYIPTTVGIILFSVLTVGSIILLDNITGTPENMLCFALGLPTHTIFSADYYPILPWVFVFFTGSFLGRLLIRENLPKAFTKNYLPWLSYIGRHTLIIYVLHQPILYGILWIVEYLSK